MRAAARALSVLFLALVTFSFAMPRSSAATLSIAAYPTAGTAPLTVRFISNVSGINPATANFTWSFQDGFFEYTQNATHTFTYGGLFTVKFSVRDNFGAYTNATVDVRVIHPVELLLGFLLFASLFALSVAIHRVFLIVTGIALAFLGFAVVLATTYTATWALAIPVFGGIALMVIGVYNTILKANVRKKLKV